MVRGMRTSSVRQLLVCPRSTLYGHSVCKHSFTAHHIKEIDRAGPPRPHAVNACITIYIIIVPFSMLVGTMLCTLTSPCGWVISPQESCTHSNQSGVSLQQMVEALFSMLHNIILFICIDQCKRQIMCVAAKVNIIILEFMKSTPCMLACMLCVWVWLATWLQTYLYK